MNLQKEQGIDLGQKEELKKILTGLSSRNLVDSKGGFWFLKGRDFLVKERERREVISENNLKKAGRILKKINHAPFLKGVFISGSLGMRNASEKSDIDFLVVAKKGRIFTVRFFLTLILDFLGERRKPGKIAGKICLNHYLTEDALKVNGTQNVYGSYLYFHNFPVINRDNIFEKFKKSNNWMKEFLIFWQRNFEPPFKVKDKSILAKFLEKILSGNFGNFIEKKLKEKQIKRKEKNYPNGVKKGRVVLKDNLIELFPFSPEEIILRKYQKNLSEFGIEPTE